MKRKKTILRKYLLEANEHGLYNEDLAYSPEILSSLLNNLIKELERVKK